MKTADGRPSPLPPSKAAIAPIRHLIVDSWEESAATAANFSGLSTITRNYCPFWTEYAFKADCNVDRAP